VGTSARTGEITTEVQALTGLGGKNVQYGSGGGVRATQKEILFRGKNTFDGKHGTAGRELAALGVEPF